MRLSGLLIATNAAMHPVDGCAAKAVGLLLRAAGTKRPKARGRVVHRV